MGIPVELAPSIGVLALVCTALHAIPRTAALGAVLLTGFLGGAISLHLRLQDPLFSHTLFPVYLGATMWVGLFLRDARVRALLPFSPSKLGFRVEAMGQYPGAWPVDGLSAARGVR